MYGNNGCSNFSVIKNGLTKGFLRVSLPADFAFFIDLHQTYTKRCKTGKGCSK